MPNTVTKQIIVDDIRKTILKVTIAGDGSGDLSNYVLYDTSSYTHPAENTKLAAIEYSLNGFTADLYWDATAPVLIMNLLKDYPYKHKFLKIGKIVNNAGAGRTGDILITTTGLGSGEKGTILIVVYKTRKNPV